MADRYELVRRTPEGAALWEIWERKMDDNDFDFENFEEFYISAMRHGFQEGDGLLKRRSDRAMSPNNIMRHARAKIWGQERDYQRMTEWDAVVNRIRRAAGLPEIHSRRPEEWSEDSD